MLEELVGCLGMLEGNLTGTIFGRGDDGLDFTTVTAVLRPGVGRLVADRVPTGVAVVDAMNHGGPYPSTGHPGFTAVGIPSGLERFTALHCYDNVPDDLLPEELQEANPFGLQRRVDGITGVMAEEDLAPARPVEVASAAIRMPGGGAERIAVR